METNTREKLEGRRKGLTMQERRMARILYLMSMTSGIVSPSGCQSWLLELQGIIEEMHAMIGVSGFVSEGC